MKQIIRKILRESVQIDKDAPHWVKTFHELPREGRIEQIEKNKSNIENLLPKINKFFKMKFGNNLVELKVTNEEDVKRRHYGNENYSTNAILLQFFFRNNTPNVSSLKKEVLSDLRSFFDIDPTYYGTPLELEFFKEVWQKI